MVLLNSSTRRDAQGKIVGALGVGQDITELDKYKATLEERVKIRTNELEESLEREKELGILKTSFVSMASHEFRTPLTAINSTAEVLSRYYDKLSREDITKRLDKIRREVTNMAIMLEDILIIGKSDSQRLDFNPAPLNIVELVKSIIYEYQLSEYGNRIVNFDINSQEINVNVDPKWIKHIVINLISNAFKYSDKNSPVDIKIYREKNLINFSFTDYGIGISKEDIAMLFDPFHRGKNVGEIAGTGLGLAVLQQAIDLHLGSINVKSELNKGSTFIVCIPIN